MVGGWSWDQAQGAKSVLEQGHKDAHAHREGLLAGRGLWIVERLLLAPNVRPGCPVGCALHSSQTKA